MALDKQDIENVAKELKGTFDEFTAKNDKRLEAIEGEKGKLAESVDSLNEKLGELDSLKTEMEAVIKKNNRPGSSEQGSAEYKEAFGAFVRKGDSSELEEKAVNTGTDSDGGFAVPEELDRNILELERDLSPMRAVCNQITIGTSDYKRLVNSGGASSGWVGEEDARNETGSPTLKQIVATMGEIYANPAATQTSLDDMFFDVEGWIEEEIAREFAEKEGSAFLLGDGTNKPKGILAHTLSADPDKTRAFGQLQRLITAASGVIGGDDLINTAMSLKKAYRKNATWMCSSLTTAKVRLLKNSEGDYLWQPGLQMDQPSKLLGRPLEENEDMPEVAANANALMLGDFRRGYTIVDRMGTRMLRDPFTNKPFVHFYTTRRTGGMLTDSQAIKVLTIKA